MNHRPLNEIAAEITKDWGSKPHPMAKQYVDAMASLRSIHDSYGADSAVAVVAGFLGVAGTWKGAKAKLIKEELRGILAMNESEIARRRADITR
jgi:hypothetical protein